MVVVVVPAYNEEGRIGRVIRGLFEHNFRDVLVVNDGSSDGTLKEALEAGATVVSHRLNRGQGAALETGDEILRQRGAEYVVHFDADEQFYASDILPALRILQEKNLDIVFGSRFLDSRSKIPVLKKYLILPIARWINFVFTGIWLSDAHNGFRILSKNALQKIVISQDKMAHNTEILQQVKKHHLKFAEVPVEVKYLEYGQGAGGGIRIVRDLILDLFIR